MHTEDFLRHVPSPIALVGNGRLIGPVGRYIDSYATIIRFNAFELDGYEAWCGARLTHWCTFGDTTTNPGLPRRHRRGLVPFSPFTPAAAESANIKSHFRRRMLFAAKDRLRNLFPRPSTGFALAMLLEDLGHRADLFGFDGFRSGHYFDAAHKHDRSHSRLELEFLISRPGFRVFSPYPTASA